MKALTKLKIILLRRPSLPLGATTAAIGDFGEELACRHLRRHGYKIERRNYKPYKNEIDIIARKGDDIHFVEVKTRTISDFAPYDISDGGYVSAEQRTNIRRSAAAYISSHKAENYFFDTVEVMLKNDEKRKRVHSIRLIEE